jgi:chemotaxis protein MotB
MPVVEEEAPPVPAKVKPIIVVRKKVSGHGGHHGGAWKVAYADFVTAMMALFIVLWLTSADEKVKEAVSAYFNNPTGPGKLTGLAAAGLGHAIEIPKDDMLKLQDKIQQALAQTPNFKSLQDHVEITITGRRLAHRVVGDRGRNVLRIRQTGAHRNRRRSAGSPGSRIG